MKKIFTALLAIMTTTALWAEGYKFVVNELEYEVWEHDSFMWPTMTLCDYESVELPNMVFVTGARHDITVANIPSTVEHDGLTYNVIGIRYDAFSGCYNLRSVTIPESVVSISPSAFNNSLLYEDERNWHDDVLYVDNCIIDCRDSLKIDHVAKSEIRLIAVGAFSHCKDFRLLVVKNEDFVYDFDCFPHRVNELMCEAGCGYITSLTLILPADTVTDGLIIQGTTLVATTNKATTTSITVPDYIDTIGYGALDYCRALESISIPKSVKHIPYNVFEGCDNLKSIIVEDGNSVFDSRDNCNAINETKTNTMMFACKATTIPTSITSIGDYAFAKKELREYLILPDHITSIGYAAFEGCENLKFVQIGSAVESIGYEAFKDCISLEAVSIPNNVMEIGEDAFLNTAIFNNDYNWQNDVLYIGNCAVDSKWIMGSCYIKPGTRLIADRLFHLSNITAIVIPYGVENIGYYAFDDCGKLESIFYTGTMAQWEEINLGAYWNNNCPAQVVHCTDGKVEL
jgi:hypothetical protein